MREYLLLLPILFIFHDMEEVVGFESFFRKNPWLIDRLLYALWYGVFLSITAHFLIHIGQTVYIRKYIPSFITSLICLPVSVIVLIRAGQFIDFNVLSVILIAAGIILMVINLKIAHLVMHRVNKQID